ncbi:MAG TPA: hypothetical protein VMR43_02530 [Variovorax sp.]|nr:hypothetical protein [Variovorax sp.]
MIAALSGYPTLHTAPPLIANAHRATELALHRLDPRIEIRTCHAHGRTTMTLQAREPVSFTLMAPLAQHDEWQQAMSALAAHGSGTVSLRGARVEGSPLMAHLVEGAVSMEVSTLPRPATLRLDLESEDGQTWPFVHTEGQVIAGTDSAVYEGRAWDGVFGVKLPIRLSSNAPHETLTFNISFDRWAGRPLAELPYTGKVFDFATRLKAAWRLRLTLEVEGEAALSVLGGPDPDAADALDIHRYLHACVRLARLAGSEARFEPSVGIGRQHMQDVLQAADDHDPRVVRTGKDFLRPILVQCLASSPDLSRLSSTPDLIVRAQETGARTLSLWGQAIELPQREWFCSRARLARRNDRDTDPAYQVWELLFDDDAPVTMLPMAPAEDSAAA